MLPPCGCMIAVKKSDEPRFRKYGHRYCQMWGPLYRVTLAQRDWTTAVESRLVCGLHRARMMRDGLIISSETIS